MREIRASGEENEVRSGVLRCCCLDFSKNEEKRRKRSGF